jgi:PAS domain-containing protein
LITLSRFLNAALKSDALKLFLASVKLVSLCEVGGALEHAKRKKKTRLPKLATDGAAWSSPLSEHGRFQVGVDADRRIVYWNEGAARQTGYPAEEVLGRRCPEDGMCHVDVGGHQLCSDSCPLVASLHDGASHRSRSSCFISTDGEFR